MEAKSSFARCGFQAQFLQPRTAERMHASTHAAAGTGRRAGAAGRSQPAVGREQGRRGQRVGQQRATWLSWIRLLSNPGGI